MCINLPETLLSFDLLPAAGILSIISADLNISLRSILCFLIVDYLILLAAPPRLFASYHFMARLTDEESF